MSLEELSQGFDGKAVCLAGEDHNKTYLYFDSLKVLDSFKPDAVAVELRTSSDSAIPRLIGHLREMENEFSGKEPDYMASRLNSSLIDMSMTYAAMNSLPLYFLDWHPHRPEEAADILGQEPRFYSFAELLSGMDSTINTFTREMEGYESDWDIVAHSEDAALDYVSFRTLSQTGYGMALRNEWTAQALNALPHQRLLYACGMGHLGEHNLRPDIVTPLQELVTAPHRFVADLTQWEMDDACVERAIASSELQLPWYELDYMQLE